MVFKSVLQFYVPPPAVVIDPMCGYRKFWELVEGTLDGQRYNILYGDRRRLEGQTWRGSLEHLPFKDETANAIVYDPPFTDTASIEAHRFGSAYETKNTALDSYVGTVDLTAMHRLHAIANQEFDRILKPKGFMICKLYDRHIDNVLHLEHACILNFFPRFILRDMVIYRVRKWGKRPKHFGKFHAYFLVLQKR